MGQPLRLRSGCISTMKMYPPPLWLLWRLERAQRQVLHVEVTGAISTVMSSWAPYSAIEAAQTSLLPL